MTHLAAGLIGGLIGVIALALSSGGFGPGKDSTPSPEVTALQQRIAKLEGAPAPAPDTQALSGLEGRVKALEDGQKAEMPKLSALSDRIAELDTSLKSLAKIAQEGGSVADAAAIGQAIEQAEQKLDAKIDEALAKGQSANAAAIEETQKAIAELRAKLGLAEAQLATAMRAHPAWLATLNERLGKLEAMLPELAGTIDKGGRGREIRGARDRLRQSARFRQRRPPYAAELDTIGALRLRSAISECFGLCREGHPDRAESHARLPRQAMKPLPAAPPQTGLWWTADGERGVAGKDQAHR
jgi:hypothetical protein